jgi:hypothetical protein
MSVQTAQAFQIELPAPLHHAHGPSMPKAGGGERRTARGAHAAGLSCCSECGTTVWVDKRLITCESAEEPNEDMSGTDPKEGADQRFEKLCVKVLHEFHEAMTMNSAAGWPFHLPQGKDDDTTVSVAEWKKVRE